MVMHRLWDVIIEDLHYREVLADQPSFNVNSEVLNPFLPGGKAPSLALVCEKPPFYTYLYKWDDNHATYYDGAVFSVYALPLRVHDGHAVPHSCLGQQMPCYDWAICNAINELLPDCSSGRCALISHSPSITTIATPNGTFS